ncbi:uncharacterized protein LOC118765647 [Octopus sinensis]|uniref:Uncharacterized protein LOC118765647 n=1 Tax=Octopus sinensis TaxID=2607531 RepID=A0A7E6FAD3_9MOLL|nr:uncharacterized protein LOC118765647 [Octopus sinensis]
MKRNGFSLRTRIKLAQKMPDAYEEMIKLRSYIINLHKNTNFELCHTANMDEVPLNFDAPSNRTVNQKGAIKTRGHEKTRTAVLACCADGTQLPHMLIFKKKDQDGMKLWRKRPGNLFKKPSMPVQC